MAFLWFLFSFSIVWEATSGNANNICKLCLQIFSFNKGQNIQISHELQSPESKNKEKSELYTPSSQDVPSIATRYTIIISPISISRFIYLIGKKKIPLSASFPSSQAGPRVWMLDKNVTCLLVLPCDLSLICPIAYVRLFFLVSALVSGLSLLSVSEFSFWDSPSTLLAWLFRRLRSYQVTVDKSAYELF